MAAGDNFEKVSDSIRSLFDLTARIDERVKTLFENSSKIDHKFELSLDTQSEILQRLSVLESSDESIIKDSVDEIYEKLHILEKELTKIGTTTEDSKKKWESMLNRILDVATKIIMAIAASAILYKLGLSHVNVPG